MLDRRTLILTFAVVCVWAASCGAAAKPRGTQVTETPHNLSVTGGGGAHNIKSTVQGEVCAFCHTPHHATQTPLWSREVPSDGRYQPYESSTMKANPKPDQPQHGSRLCLSCHDGTIALGAVGPLAADNNLDRSLPKMPYDADPKKNALLGTDLRDDHPISFAYPAVSANPELHDASTLVGKKVRLIDDIFVECNSCHDPHNNEFGKFLVLDSSVNQDALCTQCHNKTNWSDTDTAHRTGGSQYPTVSTAVASMGCVNCHLVHNAQQGEHLLKLSQVGAGEETNCYTSCHNGAPYSNVYAEFNNKTYSHPVKLATGAHKEDESLPVGQAQKHVECVDCHNPHQAGLQGYPLGSSTPVMAPASFAPNVNGPLRGVRGVDETATTTIDSSAYEFQICYKCHAGGGSDRFVNSGYASPRRRYATYNESLRFAAGNPSYHPVAANRKGNGASLQLKYQLSMTRIYCINCHLPHASDEPHIMRAQNYDGYPSITTSYPLCFSCHDSVYLLDPSSPSHAGSASLHKSHVLDHGSKAPCSSCHDPHGVPSVLGANSTDAAHLVNFDKNHAGANPVYDAFAKSCTVSCHTTNPRTYTLQ